MSKLESDTEATADLEAEKGRVALKGFFGVSKEWNCTVDDQLGLLGGVSEETLRQYADLPRIQLPLNTLERISLLLGIYKALHAQYPDPHRANQRIRLATSEPPFAGLSPIEFMARGSLSNLRLVRRYFDSKQWCA